ncbi:hypothetical protein GCM10027290_40860 [Micromonospora sonneratiae]
MAAFAVVAFLGLGGLNGVAPCVPTSSGSGLLLRPVRGLGGVVRAFFGVLPDSASAGPAAAVAAVCGVDAFPVVDFVRFVACGRGFGCADDSVPFEGSAGD